MTGDSVDCNYVYVVCYCAYCLRCCLLCIGIGWLCFYDSHWRRLWLGCVLAAMGCRDGFVFLFVWLPGFWFGFGLVWCFGLVLVVWLLGCGFACVVCGSLLGDLMFC